MPKKFVKIVNRGTCTSPKRAAFYCERGLAKRVSDTEIEMTDAAETALLKSAIGRTPQRYNPAMPGSFDKLNQPSNISQRTTGQRSGPVIQARRTGPNAAYAFWRKQVLERDGFKCVFCGSTERLEADHIKPQHLFASLRYEVDNGRTLCHDCHVKTETYGNKVNRIVDVTVST